MRNGPDSTKKSKNRVYSFLQRARLFELTQVLSAALCFPVFALEYQNWLPTTLIGRQLHQRDNWKTDYELNSK